MVFNKEFTLIMTILSERSIMRSADGEERKDFFGVDIVVSPDLLKAATRHRWGLIEENYKYCRCVLMLQIEILMRHTAYIC